MAKETITVDGISVKIDKSVINDYSITELLIKLSAPMPDEGTELFDVASSNRALSATQLVDRVLGAQKNEVIGKIRKKNKGVASTDKVIKFVAEVVTKATKTNEPAKK